MSHTGINVYAHCLLHLAKNVTEKPSVNHIGSSTSHQLTQSKAPRFGCEHFFFGFYAFGGPQLDSGAEPGKGRWGEGVVNHGRPKMAEK